MRRDENCRSSFMLLPHGLPDYRMGKAEQLADGGEINFFSDTDWEEES